MQRRESWGYLVGVVVLALLLVRSIFVVPYLPTNDGPEHVVASHIESHFGDPGTIYADVLRPATEFASRGFSLVFAPLQDLLGWQVGLQWALAFIVLAYAFGFAALVRALAPARWPIAFLGFPLALTWELYMGFFPFMVGSAVGLFILALAVRWKEPSTLQRALLGVLMLLEAFCHVFTAVLTGLVLGILMVARALGEARGAGASAVTLAARVRAAALEAGKVALMGVPAACVLLASALFVSARAYGPFARDYLVLPWLENVFVYPRLVAPGPWWRAFMTLGVLLVAVLAGSRALRRGGDVTDRALWATGLAFLVAGAVLPMNIPGWQFFSPRFLPLGILLCLATVPFDAIPRPAVALGLAAGLFGVAVAWLTESSALHRRLAGACGDAIAGLSAPVRRTGLWLPITLAPEGTLSPYPEVSEVPFLSPLRHMPMLYAVVEGGLPPETFANSPATYPFVVRDSSGKVPPVPPVGEFAPLIESEAFDRDLRLRHRVVDELARYGMRYEGILVTNPRPPDLHVLEARGFQADWQQGTVFIGHFVPCPLEVVLPPDGDVPRIDVEVGAHDAKPNLLRYGVRPAQQGEDGARHIFLPDAPCGAVRVRPHWSSTAPDGRAVESYCVNAGPKGDIQATLTWSSSRVACDGRGEALHDAPAPSTGPAPAREVSP